MTVEMSTYECAAWIAARSTPSTRHARPNVPLALDVTALDDDSSNGRLIRRRHGAMGE
jgi:hypothetical protein